MPLSAPRGARRRGFTLIEMIVVIVILGILAGIALVGYWAVTDRSDQARLQARNDSVAREVAALMAFHAGDSLSGPDYEAALADAIADLPPVALRGRWRWSRAARARR